MIRHRRFDKEASAEPKPDSLIGCKCGKCRWSDGVIDPAIIHIDDTEIVGGIRQLKVLNVEHDPPGEIEQKSVKTDRAKQLQFFDLFPHPR